VSKTARIAQVELLDGDGRVQQAWDVAAWPIAVGRALDNDLVLHDPHVAAHHARLDLDEQGRLVLCALASRNGVRIDEGAATLTLAQDQRTLLAPLATWHIGASTLRVRRAEDPLDDELSVFVRPGGGVSRKPLAALAVAVLAWTAGTLWLQNNPTSTWEAYLPPAVGVAGALLAWAALWGLASKLFTRRFALLAHLRVALMYVLAIFVTEAALGVLAYIADWPWVSRIRDVIAWALVAAMLAHHLRLVVPLPPRRIDAVVGAVAALVIVWVSALHWQRNDRIFEELYLATLAPPSWRLAPAQPVQLLIDDLRTLEAPLLETARKARDKDLDL
jgi:Inner membrane component of T3SS, cytoplasmic domain